MVASLWSNQDQVRSSKCVDDVSEEKAQPAEFSPARALFAPCQTLTMPATGHWNKNRIPGIVVRGTVTRRCSSQGLVIKTC
jgi:hypothetical protein